MADTWASVAVITDGWPTFPINHVSFDNFYLLALGHLCQ